MAIPSGFMSKWETISQIQGMICKGKILIVKTQKDALTGARAVVGISVFHCTQFPICGACSLRGYTIHIGT